MKKLFCVAILMCVVSAVMASPVRRGQWQTVTLSDGSSVRVEARGDETLLYWQAVDGRCYVKDAHTELYREVSLELLRQQTAAPATRASGMRKVRARALKSNAMRSNRLNGSKHGLVIMVDFSGKAFSMSNPGSYYNNFFNAKDYHENGFNGSVHDYFYTQSHGKFDITFDVVGPVTMSRPYSYYGRNDDDMVGEMVHDACLAVDGEVDFSKYDWDGDGEADAVYIVYAGYGQADHSDNDNYIWPHMHFLSAYSYYENTVLKLDGTVVDAYACSNEMDANQDLNGIGTVCHELSHCLGLPDLYDTGGTGNFGMGSWDLMDYGCNNDDGRTPCAYTGYEKMTLGWSMPVELTGSVAVTDMQPVSTKGSSYVVYNPARRSEFCVLDNRQFEGFDSALPGHGLMVTHVDYDEKIWNYNIVNATGYDPQSHIDNTHQRVTIYHADNDAGIDTEPGDLYPFGDNDSLTGRSKPFVRWYQAGQDGNTGPGFGIFDIKENGDGTMSFNFRTVHVSGSDPEMPSPSGDGVLLRETFDGCSGSGGNDGRFRGSIASAAMRADLNGWEYTVAYGGDRCARFGKSSAGTGIVTSPWFRLPGDTLTLTFRAAGWDAQGDGTGLIVSLNGDEARFVESGNSDVSLTMTKGKWTEYTLKIVGNGSASITFEPNRRFFLDEVVVAKMISAGIAELESKTSKVRTGRIYTIDGKFVGTDFRVLPRGVYIVDGRKFVK